MVYYIGYRGYGIGYMVHYIGYRGYGVYAWGYGRVGYYILYTIIVINSIVINNSIYPNPPALAARSAR
jgi:hypothetical protein